MPASDSATELTVIIATHNRREILRRCLESLAEQSADPGNYEVLVADDGSTDGTAEMAEGLELPYPLRVLRLSKGGQAKAQNAAIEVAAAPACLLLDDDVVASPGLVAGHVEAHRADPKAIGVGALTQQPTGPGDWFTRAVARGWQEHYEGLARRQAHWSDCYGANVSFPTAPLRQLGGIATDLDVGYDFDIALRTSDAGCTPRYLPEAHAVHRDHRGTARFLDTGMRMGAMHVELARRHPEHAAELLDWREGAGGLQLLLRRAALASHLPLRPLPAIGRVLPGQGRKMIWLHFVRRLAFWRGVKDAASAAEWENLTRS